MSELLDIIVNTLDEKQAEDIVSIDMRNVTPFTDYFVVCTARNVRHASSLAEFVEQEAEKHLYAAARKAIDEDGAQAIVLGCTGMMAMRDSLEKRLGVPVIEPYSAAIQFAASLVRMKLRQSRLSYIKGGQKTYN